MSLKHISDLVPVGRPARGFYEEEGEELYPAPRRPPVKALEELQTDHLEKELKLRLEAAIMRARNWIEIWERRPGLSYMITGPYGTGKTTILRNMLEASRLSYAPVYWDEEAQAELPDPSAPITTVYRGRFFTATQIMGIMDPGQRSSAVADWGSIGRGRLGDILGSCDLIVIDDLGTEEIPYVTAADKANVRRNRYRELLDYCLAGPRPISVLVSSNVPLLKGRLVNPEIVEILGGAAWSRLYQAAKGFMFDLSGLPDFRIWGQEPASGP